MGREWTEDELKERKLTAETAPQGRWERTKARYMGIFDVRPDVQTRSRILTVAAVLHEARLDGVAAAAPSAPHVPPGLHADH